MNNKLFILNENQHLNNLIIDSRDTQNDGYQLGIIHQEMGVILGRAILGHLPLIQKTISHPQREIEILYNDDDNIVIICLMRAGLFLSLGIFKNFPKATFILSSDEFPLEDIFKDKTVIIVDSVINTGKSILNIIENISTAKQIIIATQVIQKNAIKHFTTYQLYSIRVSDNNYLGIKNTDTGNRLFNTKEL